MPPSLQVVRRGTPILSTTSKIVTLMEERKHKSKKQEGF
jgi:hypothetical protein